jgi:hypothetical protein
VLKQSPLIGTCRNIQKNISKMFVLGRTTTKYSQPEMQQTFQVLGEYMQAVDAHVKKPGRTGYKVTNAMDKGLQALLSKDNEWEDDAEDNAQ